MTVYAFPGTEGAKVEFKSRYEHFIGGEWTPPVKGQYFENVTPVTGKVFCEVARGTAEDIDAALDAAWKAAPAWGATSAAERALVLHRIADRMEENLEMLAVAETWDNGKAVRETLNADVPLAIDHFRYFAGAIRAQEGGLSQVDEDTVAYHFHEPLGVVGQIIPWNFPLLMGVWKLAPALAAGNAVVIKPAEQTPASIMVFIELIADLLPAGVVNVVNGFGLEAGKPLAQSPRIRKIAFTGETTASAAAMSPGASQPEAGAGSRSQDPSGTHSGATGTGPGASGTQTWSAPAWPVNYHDLPEAEVSATAETSAASTLPRPRICGVSSPVMPGSISTVAEPSAPEPSRPNTSGTPPPQPASRTSGGSTAQVPMSRATVHVTPDCCRNRSMACTRGICSRSRAGSDEPASMRVLRIESRSALTCPPADTARIRESTRRATGPCRLFQYSYAPSSASATATNSRMIDA